MRDYHTRITINAPAEIIWQELTDFEAYPEWNPLVGRIEGTLKEGHTITTHIIPLEKTYYPKLIKVAPFEELIWEGTQVASFVVKGTHYYRLERKCKNQTQLLHGECFTGLYTRFIPRKLLNKMEKAFEKHNEMLKKRIESNPVWHTSLKSAS